ncbi:hypothetical protein MP228_012674 [Amoeboaphelidium protococcarum]|nr:hypothetical protein MP228_012674 [Amoeboaphelidium protococcarum]
MTVDINLNLPESVEVHPLVLLSVVDHYNRVASNTSKRVVGVLLGQSRGGVVNVANSYALPFEEDEKDTSVWFLDHHYLQDMFELFRKINSTERVVGWYHSGPKLRASDLEINQVFKRYIQHPVLVIINVEPSDQPGLPTNAYVAYEDIRDDGTATMKTFEHLPSQITSEESEEIGVEHLLRNVKDTATGDLASRVEQKMTSLGRLGEHLSQIQSYLGKVLDGQLPVNQPIMNNLQKILNLLPDLSNEQVAKSFNVVNNDRLVSVYLASLSRSIVALHELIDNKLQNKEQVQALEQAKDQAEQDKKLIDNLAATNSSKKDNKTAQ